MIINYLKVKASNTTPKGNGTANKGTEVDWARGDHVHPLQTKLGTTTVGSATRPIYLNGGTPTQINYTLAAACARGVKTLTAKSHSDYGKNNNYVPDMAMLAFWNGAYNSGNSSNLTYCANGQIIGTNNIKVLTGTIKTAANVAAGSIDINYPSGWNSSNTIVLTAMFGAASKYGIGGIETTKYGAYNSYYYGILLQDKIHIDFYPNAVLSVFVGEPKNTASSTAIERQYKIVIMKLP